MMQHPPLEPTNAPCGILLVDKPANQTSFSLVSALRRVLKVKTIGHAGTLDPFATGLMVMLIGKTYTRLSDQFLCCDKEYVAEVKLGIETDSYDCDGVIVKESSLIPTAKELEDALSRFQGTVEQIPPMFSAKKQNGKKLCDLARKGIVVERPPVQVTLRTELFSYEYPIVKLRINCSKGTYIRSIAQDLGHILGCGAHLSALRRTRSGSFLLENSIDGKLLDMPNCDPAMIGRSLITTLATK